MKTRSTSTSSAKKNLNDLPADTPLYCDYRCTYASFSDSDVSGACRRDQAVYCGVLKVYNNKNNACLVAKQRERTSAPAGKTERG